jgi:hypothetical protein
MTLWQSMGMSFWLPQAAAGLAMVCEVQESYARSGSSQEKLVRG